MKKLKNDKGFTLVELLAVIVVLAIVMGIAAVAITNVLDSTRKNAFVASAKQYIAGAKTLVNADQVEIMMGGTSAYAPKCPATGSAAKPIYVKDIPTEGGDADKSSYGNKWNKTASYVLVVATAAGSGNCTYAYHIYLTDDTYAVGTANANVASATGATTEIAEVSLASGDVLPVQGS